MNVFIFRPASLPTDERRSTHSTPVSELPDRQHLAGRPRQEAVVVEPAGGSPTAVQEEAVQDLGWTHSDPAEQEVEAIQGVLEEVEAACPSHFLDQVQKQR
jgi:hypothetical protein